MPKSWPIIFVIFLKLCSAYKPVILFHGILTGPASMLIIEGEVKKVKGQFRKIYQRSESDVTNDFLFVLSQMHPGTIVYNFGQYAGWSSLENAWHQVDELGTELMSICKVHPEGIHLLGKFECEVTRRISYSTKLIRIFTRRSTIKSNTRIISGSLC